MKIVLPVHHFPPRYSAGAELITLRLARWLQAHGHEVEVVCVEHIDRGQTHEIVAEQDRYQDLLVWRLSMNLGQVPDRFRWSYDNPWIGRWFAGYLARSRPTLVHIQSGYLLTASVLQAARAHGIPTALSLHDYWYICPRITLLRGDGGACAELPRDPAGCAWCMRLESRRYRWLDRLTAGWSGQIALRLDLGAARAAMAARRAHLSRALRWADAVIMPSRDLARRFASYVDPARMHIVRYGLDLEPFAAQRRGVPDSRLRVGFIGQIAPHKGIHLLIQAFHMLRTEEHPVELHIYGNLDANPDYVRFLRRLAGTDPRIHFHGRFENSRVAAILAGFGVTVVPSIWYEVGPLTIMESHAAGTPVIAAALGNMIDLVRDEVDGLLCQPTAADLARQLQRLIDEPTLLQRLRSGVCMPRSFDEEAGQLVAIYRSLIEQPTVVGREDG
jgi:glycosyltransferase involved in cell wall biosynthesis